jgi:hypothetical protein
LTSNRTNDVSTLLVYQFQQMHQHQLLVIIDEFVLKLSHCHFFTKILNRLML